MMSLMHKVRFYHAALAILTVLAYLSGDFGLVHDWLGYGVAVVIALRLLWAVFNPRQLGLNASIRTSMGCAWTMPTVTRR